MRQRYESSEDGADTKCSVNSRCCYLRMKARGVTTSGGGGTGRVPSGTRPQRRMSHMASGSWTSESGLS